MWLMAYRLLQLCLQWHFLWHHKRSLYTWPGCARPSAIFGACATCPCQWLHTTVSESLSGVGLHARRFAQVVSPLVPHATLGTQLLLSYQSMASSLTAVSSHIVSYAAPQHTVSGGTPERESWCPCSVTVTVCCGFAGGVGRTHAHGARHGARQSETVWLRARPHSCCYIQMAGCLHGRHVPYAPHARVLYECVRVTGNRTRIVALCRCICGVCCNFPDLIIAVLQGSLTANGTAGPQEYGSPIISRQN